MSPMPLTVPDRAAALQVALSGIDVPAETALRVARWLQVYAVVDDPDEDEVGGVLGKPFRDNHDEMVIVKDIDFVALCEHHLLPFHGRAALGYIPDGQIVGLSKVARLIDFMCRKPTLQEHITRNACNAFDSFLDPKGTIVVLYDVEHACMSMRGVKKQHAVTTTSALSGVFKDVPEARAEFLSLLHAR